MLRFFVKDSGCIIPTSHAPNRDGYIRLSIGNPHNMKMYMLHRAIYEAKYGKLKNGNEINHKCECRQCCNPDHLESLDRKTHLINTNKSRYHERKMNARITWGDSGMKMTGTRLSEIYDVSFSIACRWIRDWKKELKEK